MVDVKIHIILSKNHLMTLTELIGFIAAALTTAAYVPQAYKTIRTRSTEDLSLGTFSMLFTGVVLWLVYGFYISNLPIILSNIITSVLTGSILYLKLSTRKNPGNN